MEGVAEVNVFQYFHHLDQKFTLAVNSFNCPASDWVWQMFSNRTIWFVLYAAVAFFFFRRLGWKKALTYVLACALAILVCDQFANLIKDSVQRLRPCWDLNMVNGGLHILEGKGGKYGFFSANAANAAAFAIVSYKALRNDPSHRYDRYRVLIYLWAFLVGASRVFVGKHFLGDVLVGFVVGIIFALLISELAALIIRRLGL